MSIRSLGLFYNVLTHIKCVDVTSTDAPTIFNGYVKTKDQLDTHFYFTLSGLLRVFEIEVAHRKINFWFLLNQPKSDCIYHYPVTAESYSGK